MNQQVIQKALNIVRSRKNRAELEHNLLIKKNLENSEYQNLQKQYTRLMIENARLESEGKRPDKQKESQLKAKLDTFSNLTPKYSCPTCHDDGYVNGQMCVCLKKEISNLTFKESGIFDLVSFDEGMKSSGNKSLYYSKMKEWCHGHFDKNLIFLLGPIGSGKTYLTKCMAKEFIDMGKVVKFISSFQINQDFKKFSKTNNEEILNNYVNNEILFIDDLGTEPIYRDITLEYLYLIINERKNRKLPTIITSNLTPSDLFDRYKERITSRILDKKTSLIIEIDGQDKRIKK